MSPAQFTLTERRVTMAGVLIVFLLSALDQTIVSTAMPRIVAELHGLALYAWVTTAYLLTSTVAVPICGKLGDLFGRKPVLLASIGFFLLGSWLSGLSGEFGRMPLLGGGMTQLIAFRAVQGIGGGGLFTTAFAILGDIYPPRERAKFGGLLGAIFGLASTIGPIAGGYFTDHGTTVLFGHVVAGWRWVFYLNLPLSLLSLFMIIFVMPKMSHQARGRIDFVGAVLIIATIVPLLLALTFGGHLRPWGSPLVLGLFAASAAALGLYVVAERYASDPILPLELFRNPVYTRANLGGFLIAMSFMSTVAFLPLFIQIGQGVPATTSGLATLPLLVGITISAMISGRLVARTGLYKPFMLVGAVLTFIGILLLSRMTADTSRFDLGWRLMVLGLGLGPGQSLFTIAVQNALPITRLGVVTSSSQFFRQIGSTIGVAVFGTILTNKLAVGLRDVAPGLDIAHLQSMEAGPASGLATSAVTTQARAIIATAVTHTFGLALIVVLAAAAVIVLIPHVPMRDRRAPAPAPAQEPATAPADA